MVDAAIPSLLLEACGKTPDQPVLQQGRAPVGPQVWFSKDGFARIAHRHNRCSREKRGVERIEGALSISGAVSLD